MSQIINGTIGGRTNRTANEVTIINLIISVKLLPIKFATNGAPRPYKSLITIELANASRG